MMGKRSEEQVNLCVKVTNPTVDIQRFACDMDTKIRKTTYAIEVLLYISCLNYDQVLLVLLFFLHNKAYPAFLEFLQSAIIN